MLREGKNNCFILEMSFLSDLRTIFYELLMRQSAKKSTKTLGTYLHSQIKKCLASYIEVKLMNFWIKPMIFNVIQPVESKEKYIVKHRNSFVHFTQSTTKFHNLLCTRLKEHNAQNREFVCL